MTTEKTIITSFMETKDNFRATSTNYIAWQEQIATPPLLPAGYFSMFFDTSEVCKIQDSSGNIIYLLSSITPIDGGIF